MARQLLGWIFLGLSFTFFVSSAVAASFVSNTTSGNVPTWLNPGWRFTAQSDTAFGEGVCVEVHPVGDAGNYVRVACDYVSDAGGGVSNYQCDAFAGGVPAAFANATVEYQFLTADYGQCTNNTGNFTGFAWNFASGPTAVTLSEAPVQNTQTQAGFMLAAALALAGLSFGLLYGRRQTQSSK